MVSHTGYHKHACYLIENADLPGFTTREQKLMSRLVVAHKGNLRKVSEMIEEVDIAKAVVALRLAVLFMHSRIDIDFSLVRLRLKGRVELEFPRAWIAEHPTLAYWLEKEQEHWDEVGMDFTIRTVG